MSYITVEQIRPYVTASAPAVDSITDQPCRLHGLEWIPFFGAAVDSSTLAVKSRRSTALTRTNLTLGATSVILSTGPVVGESLIVASDSSLGTIYDANTDYLFDQHTRTLSPKPGGRLAAGAAVVVWFEPYSRYAEGIDFSLNSARGEIRRLSGGEIADGETVWLDYQPLSAPASDELLTTAVAGANGLVEREIDPSGQFGADPTLSAAALNLALEIVCRSFAMRELASLRGEDRVALAWMKLAEDHAARADRLLRSFRPPLSGPSLPTIS